MTLADGPWADDAVSYTYTNRQRVSLSLQQPGGQAAWGQSYAYDSARRLASVTSPAGTFGYAYKDGSPSLVISNGLPRNLFISNGFDDLARLLSTQLKTSGGTVTNSLSYAYTPGTNRINQVTRTTGNTVAYTYDVAGQLKTATGLEYGGSTNRLNERFGYFYDATGNLDYRTNNALVQTFNVNGLNELTNVTRSGTMTVAGLVWGTATNVTVNTSNATRYADGSFAKEGFTLTDGTNTFTAVAKDSAGRTDTNTVKPYLPATVTFACDANGNLRTNGTLILGYDDENQLITITNTGAWKTDFVYDGKMRRRERWESVWDGSKWVTNLLVRYVYDGMLVIQERQYNPQLSTTSPQLIVTYTRGRDLSSSLQGAGGICGLLARTESGPLALGAPLTTALYHADNVGNVTCLVATNGQVQARYLYEPFGTMIGMAGPLADRNLYRFSSKESHESSGLVYYGYRYYSPSFRRWMNPDVLEEQRSPNVFEFVGNRPIGLVDPRGRSGFIVVGAEVGTCVEPGIGTIIGAGIGALVTGICVGILATPSEPRPPRCGDCTPAEHATLQAAVTLACKSGRRACTATQDLDTLKANLAKNLACAAARDAINKKCFKGGDVGHQQAADDARRAAMRCEAFIAAAE